MGKPRAASVAALQPEILEWQASIGPEFNFKSASLLMLLMWKLDGNAHIYNSPCDPDMEEAIPNTAWQINVRPATSAPSPRWLYIIKLHWNLLHVSSFFCVRASFAIESKSPGCALNFCKASKPGKPGLHIFLSTPPPQTPFTSVSGEGWRGQAGKDCKRLFDRKKPQRIGWNLWTTWENRLSTYVRHQRLVGLSGV